MVTYKFSRFGDMLYTFTQKEKRENLYLLLVSRFEALALPSLSKRATQTPRRYVSIRPNGYADCHFSSSTSIASGYATYISRDIYRCFVFDKLFENLRDSEASKPKRQVNAFPHCYPHPTTTLHIGESRYRHEDAAKIVINSQLTIIFTTARGGT